MVATGRRVAGMRIPLPMRIHDAHIDPMIAANGTKKRQMGRYDAH